MRLLQCTVKRAGALLLAGRKRLRPNPNEFEAPDLLRRVRLRHATTFDELDRYEPEANDNGRQG